MYLRAWADQTETGDRDDLEVPVTDRAWRQVSVTAVDCLGASRCPQAEECFSRRARADAADADVVVTNHAMLAISAFEGSRCCRRTRPSSWTRPTSCRTG